MTKDVNVIVMDFPNTKDREIVTENDDGSYTIVINAKISHDEKLRAYQHAMRHINDEDFRKDNVQNIEVQAHEIIIPADTERIPSIEFEKRLNELKRKHAATQRRLRDYERKIEFLRVYNPSAFYDSLERQYLYGDDL